MYERLRTKHSYWTYNVQSEWNFWNNELLFTINDPYDMNLLLPIQLKRIMQSST